MLGGASGSSFGMREWKFLSSEIQWLSHHNSALSPASPAPVLQVKAQSLHLSRFCDCDFPLSEMRHFSEADLAEISPSLKLVIQKSLLAIEVCQGKSFQNSRAPLRREKSLRSHAAFTTCLVSRCLFWNHLLSPLILSRLFSLFNGESLILLGRKSHFILSRPSLELVQRFWKYPSRPPNRQVVIIFWERGEAETLNYTEVLFQGLWEMNKESKNR